MKFNRLVLIAVGALIACVGVGCTAASDESVKPSSPATSNSVSSDKVLASGTFGSTNGVSGNVEISQIDDTVSVTLDSFRDGGNQTRLVLVEAPGDRIGSCIPADAKTAGVGGSPAGPKSTFPLASAKDVAAGVVPKFLAAVLVRQQADGDPECMEPVVAVAPLVWAD